MSVTADDDVFVRLTHTALTSLLDQAARVRRNRPAHHNCPDSAPCTNCDALRLIHERIDDHLNQLDEAALLNALES